jgi:hypothetical protein
VDATSLERCDREDIYPINCNAGLNLRIPLSYILILAVVQGLTELLPVSSSAHVVVAEKLLLMMLHTGAMFAVIVYF